MPEVLEAVNRGRGLRGAEPLDALPSFHEPLFAADEQLIDRIGDDVFKAPT